ncbi:MAG: S8 family serine peptidase, partial [Planctomycetota bacterium]
MTRNRGAPMGKQLDRTRTTQTFEHLEGREMMAADSIPTLTDHVLDDILIENHSEQAPGYGSDDVAFAHNELGLSGLGQTVVIIDSGIAYDHESLGGGYGVNHRVVGGYDFAEDDRNPYDDAPEGFHGTHVAGIVGSDDDRYTGVAPGVDLVALRVFDDDGGGSFRWVESAL